MASKTYIFAFLMIFSRLAWSLNTKSLSDSSLSEHKDFHRHREFYHFNHFNNRTKTRSENGAYKIINTNPLHEQRQTLQDTRKQILASSQEWDGIVFPDTPVRRLNAAFVPEVPESCTAKGSTFCVEVKNYPEEYIDNLISNSADKWRPAVDQLAEELKINQRIGDDPAEFELCDAKEEIAYPKVAENKDKKWLSIINTQRYVQGFRVQICKTPKTACNAAATFRNGMTAQCKQKYVYREMQALDSTGNHITDFFKLPSCCTCAVSYQNILL